MASKVFNVGMARFRWTRTSMLYHNYINIGLCSGRIGHKGQFLRLMSTGKQRVGPQKLIGFGALVSGITVGSLGMSLWPKEQHAKTKEYYPMKKHLSKDEAIEIARDLILRRKDESCCPGISIAVSVDGELIWEEGLGFADLENRIPCTSKTVMRIASISKPITMAIVGKLWEDGKLDIDAPIQKYLKTWPKKLVDGEEVTITTRQVASHISGIRHYDKSCKKVKKIDKKEAVEKGSSSTTKPSTNTATSAGNKGLLWKDEEYYIMEKMSMDKALDLFKLDALCFKPGTHYLYTTHGYTAIAAVIESVSGEKFTTLVSKLFRDLGMSNTYLDENEPLIYNRARFYMKNKIGKIVNAPYVDCSYKYAGGGLLSTAPDLVKFGNAMLYSHQQPASPSSSPSLLKKETVDMLWRPIILTPNDWDRDGHYGMGWGIVQEVTKYGVGQEQRFNAAHTGGAIGGSSTLTLLPPHSKDTTRRSRRPPQGVVVAIITNMENAGLYKTSMKIATVFERVKDVRG